MAEKGVWYLHIAGEVFGPVDTKAVKLMLEQNRVQFVDFIWTESFENWERISDIDIFAEFLPKPPKIPVPNLPKISRGSPKIRMKEVAEKRAPEPEPVEEEEEEEPTPAPAPKAAPKRAPEPQPKAAPKIRRHVQVEYAEKIEVDGYGIYPAMNLREGGVMLKAKTPLPIGLEVKLSVPLPNLKKPLEMTGLVIRHAGDAEEQGFAVEFTRVNPAHKKAIQQFLERPETEA